MQMFLKCKEKQSRCGNQKGMRLWDYKEQLTPGLIRAVILLSNAWLDALVGSVPSVFISR